MRTHIFTTDPSALLLDTKSVGANISAIIVPRNRLTSDKVAKLRETTTYQVFVQERGQNLADEVPPADAAIVWLYSQIFPPSLVRRYEAGMLNMHGGKIPQYRGANVLQWAIINGEPTLGVTWHQIVDALDAGPIWAEAEIEIRPDDTSWSVRCRMVDAGLELFPVAWSAMLEQRPPLRVPDLSMGTVWPQRKDADGLIQPDLPEQRVRDLIRALCPPWPAATIIVGGRPRRVEAIGMAGDADTICYVTAEGRDLFLQLAPPA